MAIGDRPIEIYFGDNDMIEFDDALDPQLKKIEELLLEGAIYDPIGFREWHKEFKSYVEQTIFQKVKEGINFL